MGGAEMDIGVLFADVRGYTELSGGMASYEVAAMLNRFYSCATQVLGRVAIIDKLVGDEVMALYLSPLLEDGWEDEMVRDARSLLDVVGDDADTSRLRLGIGIDAGRAYVGNVGSGEVKDFTAIGEVVNTASRLTSAAAPGEVVISERAYQRLADAPRGAAGKH